MQHERKGSGCLWFILIKLLVVGAIVLSRQQSAENRIDARDAKIRATWQAHVDNGTVAEALATQRAEIQNQKENK